MLSNQRPWAIAAVYLMAALPACSQSDVGARGTGTLDGQAYRVETVLTGLEVPWSIAWSDDGRMFVTERPGRLRVFEGGTARPIATIQVEGVEEEGEHGLMGLALSPQFTADGLVYLAYTAHNDRGDLVNRIVRYRLDGDRLTDRRVLVDDLPAASYHDGLPLGFGPDGKLYASTGDAAKRQLAQQPQSLAGKFLRLNPDGSVPEDNPFPGSAVWSLGHRNSQGFDWDSAGRLYATEHGPSVPVDSLIGGGDEVNLVRRGGNYGWPTYHHDRNAPGFIAPLREWTPAIAPAGAAFHDGSKAPAWRDALFFAGLRGEALYYMKFSGPQGEQVERLERLLHQDYGRLRAVAMGPDGYLYFSTSNRDGRGQPAADDDRIFRLVPVHQTQTQPGDPGR